MARYRYRRRSRVSPRTAAVVIGGVLVLGAHANAKAGHAPAAPARAAAAAVAYAKSKIGLPYVWGGTGPDGYDCSALVPRWPTGQPGSASPAPPRSSGRGGRTSPPARPSPAIWCSSPARTAPQRHPVTSPW